MNKRIQLILSAIAINVFCLISSVHAGDDQSREKEGTWWQKHFLSSPDNSDSESDSSISASASSPRKKKNQSKKSPKVKHPKNDPHAWWEQTNQKGWLNEPSKEFKAIMGYQEPRFDCVRLVPGEVSLSDQMLANKARALQNKNESESGLSVSVSTSTLFPRAKKIGILASDRTELIEKDLEKLAHLKKEELKKEYDNLKDIICKKDAEEIACIKVWCMTIESINSKEKWEQFKNFLLSSHTELEIKDLLRHNRYQWLQKIKKELIKTEQEDIEFRAFHSGDRQILTGLDAEENLVCRDEDVLRQLFEDHRKKITLGNEPTTPVNYPEVEQSLSGQSTFQFISDLMDKKLAQLEKSSDELLLVQVQQQEDSSEAEILEETSEASLKDSQLDIAPTTDNSWYVEAMAAAHALPPEAKAHLQLDEYLRGAHYAHQKQQANSALENAPTTPTNSPEIGESSQSDESELISAEKKLQQSVETMWSMSLTQEEADALRLRYLTDKLGLETGQEVNSDNKNEEDDREFFANARNLIDSAKKQQAEIAKQYGGGLVQTYEDKSQDWQQTGQEVNSDDENDEEYLARLRNNIDSAKKQQAEIAKQYGGGLVQTYEDKSEDGQSSKSIIRRASEHDWSKIASINSLAVRRTKSNESLDFNNETEDEKTLRVFKSKLFLAGEVLKKEEKSKIKSQEKNGNNESSVSENNLDQIIKPANDFERAMQHECWDQFLEEAVESFSSDDEGKDFSSNKKEKEKVIEEMLQKINPELILRKAEESNENSEDMQTHEIIENDDIFEVKGLENDSSTLTNQEINKEKEKFFDEQQSSSSQEIEKKTKLEDVLTPEQELTLRSSNDSREAQEVEELEVDKNSGLGRESDPSEEKQLSDSLDDKDQEEVEQPSPQENKLDEQVSQRAKRLSLLLKNPEQNLSQKPWLERTISSIECTINIENGVQSQKLDQEEIDANQKLIIQEGISDAFESETIKKVLSRLHQDAQNSKDMLMLAGSVGAIVSCDEDTIFKIANAENFDDVINILSHDQLVTLVNHVFAESIPQERVNELLARAKSIVAKNVQYNELNQIELSFDQDSINRFRDQIIENSNIKNVKEAEEIRHNLEEVKKQSKFKRFIFFFASCAAAALFYKMGEDAFFKVMSAASAVAAYCFVVSIYSLQRAQTKNAVALEAMPKFTKPDYKGNDTNVVDKAQLYSTFYDFFMLSYFHDEFIELNG